MAVNINVPSQVKTYANLAAFPATGALKTIYIAEDTNKTYRWTGSVYVEVSASAASGITIGSTAIASGVVGRVLFEGAGNVVQESSSLFWDDTNNRLGIGTSTPTQTLDIVGSLNSTSSLNGDLDNLIIRNTLNGASSQTRLRFYNELTPSVTTGGAIFYTSNAYSGFPSNSFGFWNYNTNGVIAFATSVERMRIASTGNVLIGTTTDAGFRLNVNGTARVQDTFSALNASSNGIRLTNGPSIEFWAAVSRITLQRAGNNALVIGGQSGFAMSTVNAGTMIGGVDQNSLLASAQLQVDSTTKGFLPPRMTTTQKNAIASPAAGLVVYDTTLNKLCVYTTAWETVTSL